jgi:hypothetical protein
MLGEKRTSFRMLMGKPEVKRTLGRPRFKWEDGVWLRIGISEGHL